MSVLGYQRELTYKRTDGSYSAFGNSDGEGNMWYVPYETFFLYFVTGPVLSGQCLLVCLL